MSGGLIDKLKAAEIQRDKYKEKWRISVESEKKTLRRLAKLESKIRMLNDFMYKWVD